MNKPVDYFIDPVDPPVQPDEFIVYDPTKPKTVSKLSKPKQEKPANT